MIVKPQTVIGWHRQGFRLSPETLYRRFMLALE
jgi:hypothetical protein